jgi:hypothetical protein
VELHEGGTVWLGALCRIDHSLGPSIGFNFNISDEITINRFTKESATLNYLNNRDISMFPAYDNLVYDTEDHNFEDADKLSTSDKSSGNVPFEIKWVKNTLNITIKTNRQGIHNKEYSIFGLGTFDLQRIKSSGKVKGASLQLDVYLPENVKVVEREPLFGWMDQGVNN